MKLILKKIISTEANIDLGLLVFRVLAAVALIRTHGLPKLLNIQESIAHIPDPLNLGGVFSTYFAIFTNVICAIFIGFGFMTRLAALMVLLLTLSGLFLVHLSDPANVQDTPLIYSIVFGFIAYMGAGKFSIDRKLF